MCDPPASVLTVLGPGLQLGLPLLACSVSSTDSCLPPFKAQIRRLLPRHPNLLRKASTSSAPCFHPPSQTRPCLLKVPLVCGTRPLPASPVQQGSLENGFPVSSREGVSAFAFREDSWRLVALAPFSGASQQRYQLAVCEPKSRDLSGLRVCWVGGFLKGGFFIFLFCGSCCPRSCPVYT